MLPRLLARRRSHSGRFTAVISFPAISIRLLHEALSKLSISNSLFVLSTADDYREVAANGFICDDSKGLILDELVLLRTHDTSGRAQADMS